MTGAAPAAPAATKKLKKTVKKSEAKKREANDSPSSTSPTKRARLTENQTKAAQTQTEDSVTSYIPVKKKFVMFPDFGKYREREYHLGTITLEPVESPTTVEQEEDSDEVKERHTILHFVNKVLHRVNEYETTTEGRRVTNITMLVPGGDGPEGKEQPQAQPLPKPLFLSSTSGNPNLEPLGIPKKQHKSKVNNYDSMTEVEKDEFLRQNGIRMVPVPEIDLFSDDDDEEEDEVNIVAGAGGETAKENDKTAEEIVADIVRKDLESLQGSKQSACTETNINCDDDSDIEIID